MRLHLWDGHGGRTFCGRTYSPGLNVAKVRDVDAGAVVEHCGDDLPKRVCRGCCRTLDRKFRGSHRWWWRRAGGGKWLAQRLIPKAS